MNQPSMLLKRLYSTKKSVEDAFTRRLADLESEVIKGTDPLLGDHQKSLIDQDSRLLELSAKLEQKKFEFDNQKLIQATKIPMYAGKQTRDIAYSQPWTGQESSQDSTLRMLVDKHKPLRVKSEVKKLAGARETVLDYRINKNADPEADKKFKELYQEKFTPIGSFDKIKNIADARIEEHMKQGGFKNIRRGKKLEGNAVGMYVDRTEHHLNNILVNQNIVPPWIEKQGGVNLDIANFKKELIERWKTYITLNHTDDHKQMQRDFTAKYNIEYQHKVRSLNNSIRTYNLQAPMPTQKFYAIQEKEFEKCFESVNVQEVMNEYKEELLRRKLKMESQPVANQGPGFLSRLFGFE